METTRTLSRSATSAVSVYMRQVYGWMTAGLALTSVVAYAVASSPAVQMAIFSNSLIPIILIVWVGSYVEKFATKILPDFIKYVLRPLLVMVVMIPLSI